MYRWNSRFPTVRWKDNFEINRVTSSTTDTSVSSGISDASEETIIIDSKKGNSICSKTSTNSSQSLVDKTGSFSAAGSGNLSGSALTFSTSSDSTTTSISTYSYFSSKSTSEIKDNCKPITGTGVDTKGSVESTTTNLENKNSSTSISSIPTDPDNFDTIGTGFNLTTKHPSLLSTSTVESCGSGSRLSERNILSFTNSSYSSPSSFPTDDQLVNLQGRNNDTGADKSWNVISKFFFVVGIVVREIRTVFIALFIRLLVNPINYCIYSSTTTPPSSVLCSSIYYWGATTKVPGGSSLFHQCCKKKKSNSPGCGSNSVSSFSPSRLQQSCSCCVSRTCNCISFLEPIFDLCCCWSNPFSISSRRLCGRKNISNGSCFSFFTSFCKRLSTAVATLLVNGGVGKGKPKRLGKMAYFLSKTMTLLGVAFVIHFIIMSTFAEKEGFHPKPRYSPKDSSSYNNHYYHHKEHQQSQQHHQHHSSYYHDGMDPRLGKRLARSYRHEKQHPTTVPDPNLTPLLTGGQHSSSRLLNNKSEAVFSTENSTIIIAQISSKTYLPCAVKNLGSGVASWIRRRDYHLLTVGMGTYSNDDRFIVSHNRPAQSWELHIKYVKPSDEGIYECQISTHPPSSIFVHLRVVEAKAEILGEPDKHVRSGSTFELVCVLRDSTEPPVYVFWYHNDRMINYDNVRGVQVSSDAEKSILTIQEAQKSDSGNYTCVPSNARPTSISVHILNGEKPAAMQHGSRSHSPKLVPGNSTPLLFVTTILVFLLTSWLATANMNHEPYSYAHTLLYLQKEKHKPHPHHHPTGGKQDIKKGNRKKAKNWFPILTKQTASINKRMSQIETPKDDLKEATSRKNCNHQFYLHLSKNISKEIANKPQQHENQKDNDGMMKDYFIAAENGKNVIFSNEFGTIAISTAISIYTLDFLVKAKQQSSNGWGGSSKVVEPNLNPSQNQKPQNSSPGQIDAKISPISLARHLSSLMSYYPRQVLNSNEGNDYQCDDRTVNGNWKRIIFSMNNGDATKVEQYRKQLQLHLIHKVMSVVTSYKESCEDDAKEVMNMMRAMEQWAGMKKSFNFSSRKSFTAQNIQNINKTFLRQKQKSGILSQNTLFKIRTSLAIMGMVQGKTRPFPGNSSVVPHLAPGVPVELEVVSSPNKMLTTIPTISTNTFMCTDLQSTKPYFSSYCYATPTYSLLSATTSTSRYRKTFSLQFCSKKFIIIKDSSIINNNFILKKDSKKTYLNLPLVHKLEGEKFAVPQEQPPTSFQVIIMNPSIVIPKQVLIIIIVVVEVLSVIIIRRRRIRTRINEEVDFSSHPFHHHHHLPIIFPSVPSRYNSLIRNDLLLLPFLLLNSFPLRFLLTSSVGAEVPFPSAKSKEKRKRSRVIITSSTTMNKTTSLQQPSLFCLKRNKAEEQGAEKASFTLLFPFLLPLFLNLKNVPTANATIPVNKAGSSGRRSTTAPTTFFDCRSLAFLEGNTNTSMTQTNSVAVR